MASGVSEIHRRIRLRYSNSKIVRLNYTDRLKPFYHVVGGADEFLS